MKKEALSRLFFVEIRNIWNRAINRLVNQAKDDSYRGKYEGGRHKFSDTDIRHIITEHGDFLREGLRAQLPMRKEDIARHLSAIKDNKEPSNIKPTRTAQGGIFVAVASIMTTEAVKYVPEKQNAVTVTIR